MSDLDHRIWEFLPARRDRRRTTVAPVIAANLGAAPRDVQSALIRMERGGHVFADRLGSWHRGTPLEGDHQ